MSQTEPTRLTTFDATDDETLVVLAGQSEQDQRIIYQGRAQGRYAVVPADGLEADSFEKPDELELDDMRLVESVGVPEDGETTVSLTADGREQLSMSYAGVYGLLWIPAGD
jgi:hypothetical protein